MSDTDQTTEARTVKVEATHRLTVGGLTLIDCTKSTPVPGLNIWTGTVVITGDVDLGLTSRPQMQQAFIVTLANEGGLAGFFSAVGLGKLQDERIIAASEPVVAAIADEEG